MPRKRQAATSKRSASADTEAEDTSEYEESSHGGGSSAGDDFDDDDDEPPTKKATKPIAVASHSSMTAASTTKKKKTTAFRSAFRSTNGSTISRSLYDKNGNRLTERGGYQHMEQSKLKISMSNRGKTPWNKDKQRSGTDKAKISAGVKARNRAVLLQQLSAWNMQEDEYLALKKKTKLVRERLRRTRVANNQITTNAKKKVKLEPESESESESDIIMEEDPSHSEDDDDDDDDEQEDQVVADESAVVAMNPAGCEGFESQDPGQLESVSQNEVEAVEQQVDGDYVWEPHPFDSADASVYALSCPNGGPGGLICCAVCTADYSRYMSSTYNSMAQQTISLVGWEANELGTFLTRATEVMNGTLPGTSAAKTKRAK